MLDRSDDIKAKEDISGSAPDRELMAASTLSGRRIAKNTIMLYVRMFLVMSVSIFTSRLILDALGVDDFGVFNVIGGLVAMFCVFNSTMSNATVRFITFAIGEADAVKLKRTFNAALAIHIIIAIIVIVLTETVGVWFLYNEMNIDPEKMNDAFWILQFSILSTAISIVTLPVNSLIAAHEKMGVYAYMSIVDVCLKLGIVYILLSVEQDDRLILYGLLLLFSQVLYMVVNLVYCRVKFRECRLSISFNKDKLLFKDMLSFSGWSMFGCVAAMGYTQGLNMLLNVFGGVAVNAARAISVQVQSIVLNFSGNFQAAITPQIVKSYAQGNWAYMHRLVYVSSKYSFFLMYLISLPLMVMMPQVLGLWLKEVPDYSVVFVRLILLITLINVMSNPLMKSVDATGKIKRYHIVVGGFLILILPVSWVALRLDAPLETVFVIQLVFSVAALFLRLYVSRPLTKLTITGFVVNVIKPSLLAVIPSALGGICFAQVGIQNEFIKLLIVSVVCVILSAGSIWLLGMDNVERNFAKSKIRTFKQKMLWRGSVQC